MIGKSRCNYAGYFLDCRGSSEALSAIHLATIVWDDVEKVVLILASGYKPLLGTAMMEGYHPEIDFEDNGLVSLEKIQSPMS
jgi:predicted aspartyl protease